MRAVVSSVLLLLPVLASATPPRGHNDHWYEAQAANAARDCLDSVTSPGDQTLARVSTVSACFAGGFITDVDFTLDNVLLATVQFGCDDTVISTTCVANACDTDDDCSSDSWCAPTNDGSTECRAFATVGETCGGFVLPDFYNVCEPGLTCVYSEPTYDIPGTCEL